MNLVLDDAEELALKDKSRKKLGTFFVPFFFFFPYMPISYGCYHNFPIFMIIEVFY